MAQVTQTNEQYYASQQVFIATAAQTVFVWTGGTNQSGAGYNSIGVNLIAAVAGTSVTNFEVYVNNVKIDQGAGAGKYQLTSTNTITLGTGSTVNDVIKILLIDTKTGQWDNHDTYSTITINDIISNFQVAYVGAGKLIPSVKRTDLMFHAKRGLQEFSYDTLKSTKSQELTIPANLSLLIPQDYVNYVSFFRIDGLGVQRPIYPTNLLHQSPQQVPVQDANGIPTQDDASDNLEGTSLSNSRWSSAEDYKISGAYTDQMYNEGVYDWGWEKVAYGQRYGLNPETSQSNGWFNINYREGKIMFSSNLANELIIFTYISDGLAADGDMRISKMAEEAMYMHMLHAVLSTKANIPEYIVRRYKIERRAALRNAKIRLSNIKLQEFVQVMRGKSKWIKH
tara:strand:+ start:441 stop:1628 length:1188 start_codon:yes stop_codon:yes gene_type:complete